MTISKKHRSHLQQHFLATTANLWPVLKGSLVQIRKPCIRPNCAACARGVKHPAFILTFRHQRRRRCLYVPAQLVPHLRQGLQNGRRLEALLYQMGPALLQQLRQSRDSNRKA